MKSVIRGCVVLVALMASATLAYAEIIYRIPKGFGWRQGIPLQLLEEEAVQKDLGLSAETAFNLAKWKELFVTAMETEVPKSADPAKRVELIGLVQAKYQSQLDQILTPEQQTRLHEIHLQKAGLDALSDAAVAMELNLTAEQQKQILAVHQRMLSEEKALVKRGRLPGALSKAGRDELLLGVLSSEQQQMFAGLKGKPFDEMGCLPTLRLRGREIEIWNVAFSPDGSRLASSRQSVITLWDAASGESQLTLLGHAANVTSLGFTSDGKAIVSGSADKTIRSWDAASGQNLLTMKIRDLGGYESVRSVALSPDGTQLAHAYGSTMATWYRFSPLEKPFLRGGTSYPGLVPRLPVWSLAFCPDGKRQACGRSDGSVYIIGNGNPFKTTGCSDVAFCLAFSADGRRLAAASADGTVKLWDAMTGQETLSLKAHDRAARSVAFSPDGRQLASAGDDGTVKLWQLDGRTEPLAVKQHTRQVTSVAFSPDGKRLASAGGDNSVRVWDSTNGEELFSLSP